MISESKLSAYCVGSIVNNYLSKKGFNVKPNDTRTSKAGCNFFAEDDSNRPNIAFVEVGYSDFTLIIVDTRNKGYKKSKLHIPSDSDTGYIEGVISEILK